MTAALDHARSMMAAFQTGWESTGTPITREEMRKHAEFMAGIERGEIAKKGEHPFSRAELEAYEQIAREYAEPAPVDSASHRSSSQAGLASLSTSGGAVTSTPAPSEAPIPRPRPGTHGTIKAPNFRLLDGRTGRAVMGEDRPDWTFIELDVPIPRPGIMRNQTRVSVPWSCFVPDEAPVPDHGPLAATLSDRTLDKVLSRPAHVPSIVLLDRDAAAQHLAAEVASLLTKFSDNLEMFLPVRAALADYEATR